jgi:hypothetical protein
LMNFILQMIKILLKLSHMKDLSLWFRWLPIDVLILDNM